MLLSLFFTHSVIVSTLLMTIDQKSNFVVVFIVYKELLKRIQNTEIYILCIEIRGRTIKDFMTDCDKTHCSEYHT